MIESQKRKNATPVHAVSVAPVAALAATVSSISIKIKRLAMARTAKVRAKARGKIQGLPRQIVESTAVDTKISLNLWGSLVF